MVLDLKYADTWTDRYALLVRQLFYALCIEHPKNVKCETS